MWCQRGNSLTSDFDCIPACLFAFTLSEGEGNSLAARSREHGCPRGISCKCWQTWGACGFLLLGPQGSGCGGLSAGGALGGLLRHVGPGPAPWSPPFPGAVPAAKEQKMESQGHPARNTHKHRLLIHSWNCQEKPISI